MLSKNLILLFTCIQLQQSSSFAVNVGCPNSSGRERITENAREKDMQVSIFKYHPTSHPTDKYSFDYL